MGQSATVTFPTAEFPAWPALMEGLRAAGHTPKTMLIDGQLSFPDEVPPAGWREVRVGLGGEAGMVTLRAGLSCGRATIAVVTWGNAAGAVLDGWRAAVKAIAASGGGAVDVARDAAACG